MVDANYDGDGQSAACGWGKLTTIGRRPVSKEFGVTSLMRRVTLPYVITSITGLAAIASGRSLRSRISDSGLMPSRW